MSPPVDRVAVEARCAAFAKRSIKREAKAAGLRLAISMMDLTTLEGADTVGKVRALCGKALQPSVDHPDWGRVAAVCVYPTRVRTARQALAGSELKVASVATAFPSGQSGLELKLEEVSRAVGDGADEIDMVIDRGAFLAGEHTRVADEIAQVKERCGERAHLKVILETGELGSLDAVRAASDLALAAGGDFIKTSTGKLTPAATLPVTLVMLQAIADHFDRTGERRGMKPAGGIRTAKQALAYLVMVKETLGPAWLTPELFRFGASSLLDDVLMQLDKLESGAYSAAEYFPVA